MAIRTKRIISAMLSLIMAFGMLFAVGGQAVLADQNSDILDSLGEYTEQVVDFSFKYRGASFDMMRTYHSGTNTWFYSYQTNIALANNNTDYVLTFLDGEEITLSPDNNVYTDSDEQFSMTISGNDASVKYGDLTYVYDLNNNGRIKAVKDIENKTINFTYYLDNGNNYLELIEIGYNDTFFGQTVFGWSFLELDEHGRLSEADNQNRETLKYSYESNIQISNGFNNLATVKYDKDQIKNKRSSDIIVSEYEYTNSKMSSSNNSDIEYTSNRVSTVINQAGEETEYTYRTTTFNAYPLPDVETDYTLYEVKIGDDIYAYNSDKELALSISGDSATVYGKDNDNNITETYYKKENNVFVLDEEANSRNEGEEEQGSSNTQTQTTYYDNEHEHIMTETITETNGDNETITVNNYSLIGLLNSTNVTYNENNETVKTEQDSYNYDGAGFMTTHQHSVTEDNETTSSRILYTNDYDGKVLQSKDNSSGTDIITKYKYDPFGNIIYEKTGSKVTRKIYDEYSRLVQEIEPEYYTAANDKIISQGEDKYTDTSVGHRYYYNSSTGNLTTEINALGVETNYTYFPDTSKVAVEIYDQYRYEYNQLGEPLEIKVANNIYASYNYNSTTGYLDSVDYGNGQSILYTYNSNGNVTQQQYKENANATPVTQFDYTYNNDGELTSKIDHNANQKTVYGENNLVTVYAPKNAAETPANEVYSYYDREEKTETVTDPDTQEETEVTTPATSGRDFGSTSLVTTFTDNTANIKLNNADYLTVETVENERQKKESKEVKNASDTRVLKTEYTYDDDGNAVASTITGLNNYETSTQYSYDDKGRLTEYTQQFSQNVDPFNFSYGYTDNQLSRENIDLGGLQKTYTHTYDSRGNYKKLKEYEYTTGEITESATNTDVISVEYENGIWLDEITSAMGETVIHDAAGNPISVSELELTWTNGRQLKSLNDGNTHQPIISFTYDENGIRTSKTYGTRTTYYTNVDGQITSQYELDSNGNKDNEIIFIYDGDDLIGARYYDNTYYYVKNIFGDVTNVLNEQGQSIVDYSYTAWGQMLFEYRHPSSDPSEFSSVNPMKYRSYYYDSEIDMYYLQSRYYWLPLCRFLNADLPEYAKKQKNETAGINLFAYCNNDPVNNSDPTGNCKREDICYIEKSKLKNRKKKKYSMIVNYASGSIKFKLEIIVGRGKNNNRKFEYLETVKYKIISCIDSHIITKVLCSYGCSNMFYSQGVALKKSDKTNFKYSAPSKWKAVNCSSFDNIKSYTGCTIIVYFKRGKSSTIKYIEAQLLSNEQRAELYTKSSSNYRFIPYSLKVSQL